MVLEGGDDGLISCKFRSSLNLMSFGSWYVVLLDCAPFLEGADVEGAVSC